MTTVNAEVIREAIQKLYDALDAELDAHRLSTNALTTMLLGRERTATLAALVAVNGAIAGMPIGSQVSLKSYQEGLAPGVIVHPDEAEAQPVDYTEMIPVRWSPSEEPCWEYIGDLKPHRA